VSGAEMSPLPVRLPPPVTIMDAEGKVLGWKRARVILTLDRENGASLWP